MRKGLGCASQQFWALSAVHAGPTIEDSATEDIVSTSLTEFSGWYS